MEITFKEQFDKLTRAYISNQVNPYDGSCCFIGNLLDGNSTWMSCRIGYSIQYKKFGKTLGFVDIGKFGQYTSLEIIKLERTFLESIWNETGGVCSSASNYEDALFHAFEKTLDVLKGIHEKHGEGVNSSKFEKRILQDA